MTKITIEQKQKIKQLHKKGFTYAQIGRELQLNVYTVKSWTLTEDEREKLKANARIKVKEYCEKRLQKLGTNGWRFCPRCKQTKHISEFYKTNSMCKECKRKYENGRIYLRSNKLKAQDKIRRKIKKKEIALILGNKCQDCGLTVTDENLCVFDLHHKNLADKEKSGDNWRKPIMLQLIREDKIVLLCSNCHRLLHHKNGDILYVTRKTMLKTR